FHGNGSIDFTSNESVFTYDREGAIDGITRKESLESHKIIEYFMISANICAADFIEKHGKTGMYRVHDIPAVRDIEEFNAFMRALGLEVKLKNGTNAEFQRVLSSIKGNPKSAMIERNLLRAMKLAKYSEKNSGHFGLGLPSYTHFTSPIRRYADVLVHRLIKHFLGLEAMKDTGREYLKEAAAKICDCEERSEKAENDMFRLFALDFLKSRMGGDFEAVITKVTKNGLLCELQEYPVEGFVSFDSMYGDYFVFDPYTQSATGRRTKKKYRTGDSISVIICRVDLESLKLELELFK
ncbi:MAG: RNB domain-containing ribonuclease, partial [Spirochaetia bacterium]|nr:RNB domain-containing ribonuclease [Spirochaetia bacterium]